MGEVCREAPPPPLPPLLPRATAAGALEETLGASLGGCDGASDPEMDEGHDDFLETGVLCDAIHGSGEELEQEEACTENDSEAGDHVEAVQSDASSEASTKEVECEP